MCDIENHVAALTPDYETAIKEELKHRGLDAEAVFKQEETKPQGMRFFIPVNDAKEGESQTIHVVHGTFSRRENKNKLRAYLMALGYKPKEHKAILKGLNLWSKKQLGTQA